MSCSQVGRFPSLCVNCEVSCGRFIIFKWWQSHSPVPSLQILTVNPQNPFLFLCLLQGHPPPPSDLPTASKATGNLSAAAGTSGPKSGALCPCLIGRVISARWLGETLRQRRSNMQMLAHAPRCHLLLDLQLSGSFRRAPSGGGWRSKIVHFLIQLPSSIRGGNEDGGQYRL